MKMPTLIIFQIVMFAIVGCNSVTIKEPLGERTPNAPETLKGIWASEDGKVIEACVSKRGELFAGAFDWNEAKNKFEAETLKVLPTRAGKLQLLNFIADPKLSDGRFAFIRYEIDDGKTVRVYLPAASVFEQTVKSGKLKGTVRKQQFTTEVQVDEPAKAVLDFITKSGVDKCFESKSYTLKLVSLPD
jgi:hypothetical protein